MTPGPTMSPDEARRLLRDAVDPVTTDPSSLFAIRAGIAHRRRRRMATWTIGTSVMAVAAAVVAFAVIPRSSTTKLSLHNAPIGGQPAVASSTVPSTTVPTTATTATTVQSLPAPTLPPVMSTTTTTVKRPLSAPAVEGDVDGDGIPDHVSVSLSGSDIILQADLTALGTQTLVVKGHTGSTQPAVLGITDTFGSGFGVIFIGTGRNEQLGTAVSTLVTVVGNHLQQVQVQSGGSYTYVTLNYNVGATGTLSAYGCTENQLYVDTASEDLLNLNWKVQRQTYRLSGLTLVAGAADPQPNQATADKARTALAKDSCGSVSVTATPTMAGAG